MLNNSNILVFSINSREIVMNGSRLSSGISHPLIMRSAPYSGYSGDSFNKPEEVFNAICDLYAQAEACINTPKTVYLALPSSLTKSYTQEVECNIVGKIVTEEDIERCHKQCVCDDPIYTILDYFSVNYKSFNNPIMTDPIGQECDKLYATVNFVCAPKRVKELFDNCAKRIGKRFVYVSVDYTVLDGINAKYSAPNTLRLVLNMQDEITSFCLCQGKAILDKNLLFIGGDHFVEAIIQTYPTTKQKAQRLLNTVNLNLPNTAVGNYSVFSEGLKEEFSIQKINTVLKELIGYLVEEIKGFLSGYMLDNVPPIYITGCKECHIKGIKKIFYDNLNTDIIIVEDSGRFFLNSLTDIIKRETKSSIFGRITKFTQWRKNNG